MSADVGLHPPGSKSVSAPYRFPAAVQPHGALLVVDVPSRLISHASENTLALLGVDAPDLLGQPVGRILDATTVAALKVVLDEEQDISNPTVATIGGRTFEIIVRRLDHSVIVEFEPYAETPRSMTLGTRQAMRRFASVSSRAELWELAASEFRRITGFDRVMFEHFHSNGDGEIVAESATAELESRVGLRLPSSGIPDQARTLASIKLSRMIVNTTSAPVALLGDPRLAAPEIVDLSQTELRAVTAHHLAFMRNHDMISSFTLSVVHNNALIGMIIGGHRTERRLPFYIRDGFEILANQVALQLTAMRELEEVARREELRGLRSTLAAGLAQSDDLVDALLHQPMTVLDLIPADGAAVRLGDRVDSIGAVPPVSALRALVPDGIVSERLATDHPELAAALPGVAGLLVQPLSHQGDYIAWFRAERTRFPGWAPEFEGTSEPWDGLEREAHELARDLQTTLLRRAESLLAELALQDPLTGLPNRRLLMDRLQQEILRLKRGEQLAVLFVDLDRFKSINDSFGHAAGDAALRHAAAALREAARAEDTVARLGGDEFVVLCPGVGPQDARTVAARIVAAIGEPPADRPTWTVSASIGISIAADGAHADDVLSAADAALYRAKLVGERSISD